MKHDSSARRKIHPVCLPQNQRQATGENVRAEPLLTPEERRRGLYLIPTAAPKLAVNALITPPMVQRQAAKSKWDENGFVRSNAIAPDHIARRQWFYSTDWIAIPLCALWAIAYIGYSIGSFRITHGGPIVHVSTAFVQMFSILYRAFETIARWFTQI